MFSLRLTATRKSILPSYGALARNQKKTHGRADQRPCKDSLPTKPNPNLLSIRSYLKMIRRQLATLEPRSIRACGHARVRTHVSSCYKRRYVVCTSVFLGRTRCADE